MGQAVNEASPGFGRSVPLDTLVLLRASQELSYDYSASKLKARLELLASYTGATKVVLALWDEDANDWGLPSSDAHGHGPAGTHRISADQLPLSVLRHAQRAAEPLLLANAVTDQRFAGDAYFAEMERCSLIVMPIIRRWAPRAMLFVENRLSEGAFGSAQLEAVMIIAAQLAASLDNERLFERLELMVSEQTRQLHEAQTRLQAEAHRADMAQSASNVLHNVGNVLTSVNVSAQMLAKEVQQSPASRVGEVARLLNQQGGDLETFFSPDGPGRALPQYLRELAVVLGDERERLLAELLRLCGSVEHIKNVIAMPLACGAVGGLLERASICDIVEEALRMQEASMTLNSVQVLRDYAAVDETSLDRTRLLQILVNLLENARQATAGSERASCVSVVIRQEEGCTVVSVRDNGCGIAAANLHSIFSRGFTTKADGHGFGLHSCSIAAREMGGSLSVSSDGPGTGATFMLRLPVR